MKKTFCFPVLILSCLLIINSCSKASQESIDRTSVFPPNNIEIISAESSRNGPTVQVHFKIFSKITDNAYILFHLQKSQLTQNGSFYEGFGDTLKIDGYSIGSYHQFLYYDYFIGIPAEFSLFIKKVKLSADNIYSEVINIGLPNCYEKYEFVGVLEVFRENEYFENLKKVKLIEMADHCNDSDFFQWLCERYTDDKKFRRYYEFFPDSSIFSYAITDDMLMYLCSLKEGLHSMDKKSLLF